MYITGNEIDSDQKITMSNTLMGKNSNTSKEAVYQLGLECLRKNKPKEALCYFLNAVDFGYTRALLPAIILEIGTDIPCEQSRSIDEVLKQIEKGCAGGDEVATLILAHWSMDWSIDGNGIKLIDLDTFELSSNERQLLPIEVDDVPELQIMSLSRLDRLISAFGHRILSMGYLSDRVNTKYAIQLLKQLVETGESKAFLAEQYLYYLLTDNYEQWIDELLPWLQYESHRGNVHAINLLLKINYRNQRSYKTKQRLTLVQSLT